MITWLQNFLLKHNSWLMTSLLAVIVAVFVFSVGPTSFFHRDSQRQRQIDYYGFDLSNPKVAQDLQRKAEVSYALNRPAIAQDDYLYARIAALGLAHQMGILPPTEAELKDYVMGLELFQNPETGKFSKERYDEILTIVTTGYQLDEVKFTQLLRDEWVIGQVLKAISGPGYGSAFLDFKSYQAFYTEYKLKVAELDFANFTVPEKPSEEDLRAFYDENPGAYTVPEKLKATAVIIPYERYLERVAEPSDAEVQAYYDRNGWRYVGNPTVGADGKLQQGQPMSLEEARPRVLADLKMDRARALAAEQAVEFTVALDEEDVPRDSEAFNAAVARFGAHLEVVEPYTRAQTQGSARISKGLLEDLWNYREGNRYFTNGGQTSAGGVVLVRDAFIPETIPPFEEVRAQVEAKWQESSKRRAFTARGLALHKELAEAVAAGQPFADAAQAAGMIVRDIEPFNGQSVPYEFNQGRQLGSEWDQLRLLSQGEVSNMQQRSDKGVIVYIEKKTLPDVTADTPEVKTVIDENARQMAASLGWKTVLEIASKTLRQKTEGQ